jgi:predicted transcriptional regulator
MTFAEEKRKRVIAILEYIVKNQKTSKDQLIGHFCLEWGLRHQKINEYLAELEALGLIKLERIDGSIGKFDVFDYMIWATEKGIAKVKELVEEEEKKS